MPPDSLSPDESTRLLDLARACKAAARIVSLYPPTHPNIKGALARITEAGERASAGGPFVFAVLPDAIAFQGRQLARPDAVVTEFAAMLHAHHVGEVTLAQSLRPAAWHTFLLLLSQPAEVIRSEGGITRAWAAAGGGPLYLREIDYIEVLREKTGDQQVDWEKVLQGYLEGEKSDLDDETLAALLEIASDAQRLADFLEQALGHAAEQGVTLARQRAQLVKLLQALATFVARSEPQQLDRILRHMVGALPQLQPEMVTALLSEPPPVGADGRPEGLDLAAAMRERLDDGTAARFLANTIARERGASGRLAEAFQVLVPDQESRGRVLEAAEQIAQESTFGKDPRFPDLWKSAADLLRSYSDDAYISDSYASDLSKARTAAIELDRISDDPSDRLATWVATVSDDQVRRLDQQVLADLLIVESREDAWRQVLALAMQRIDQLVLVGDLPPAQELLDTILRQARDKTSQFRQQADEGLRQLAKGDLPKHLVLYTRQAEEHEMSRVTRFCLTLGKVVIGTLIDAMLAEENSRTIRRLREVLLSFGSAARAHVDELRRSPNPAVRRTAVELLRAFGGADALPDLAALLDDAEPQVQREALRAIVQIGTGEAFATLERALKSGAPHTRDAIMHALGTLRDERAAPLFIYIIRHSDHRGPLEGVYCSALTGLGTVGASDADAVPELARVLRRGEWWSPGRTRRIRTAAAEALRALGTPEALGTLTDLAQNGSGGARRAARVALAVERAAPAMRPS